MRIKEILFRKIYDSRAIPTLEVEVINNKGLSFLASVPSGKSKSKKEAATFDFKRINQKSYFKKIEKIKKYDFKSIKNFDYFLLDLDGTKNKTKLGGNVILGLSLAFGRALAFEKKTTFRKLIETEFFKENANRSWNPVIFSNFINGGEHSPNNLDIQEYLILAPLEKDMAETIEALIKLYKTTGEYLKKKFKLKTLPLGDENGYALNFQNNLEPLFILENLIRQNKRHTFALGIDAAANSFWDKKNYIFENKKINSSKLQNVYLNYFKKLTLLESIEDPFEENDFKNFKKLKENLHNSKIIIGDDLTATSAQNLYKYKDCINGIIIKPNQVGTITETAETCILSKKLGIRTIFSHRSGETEDHFIVEFAYAARAFGLKIGAPFKDRITKFNEILRLMC